MSYVNAFYALFLGAKVPEESLIASEPTVLARKAEMCSTADKVVSFFKQCPIESNPPYFIDYAGGRLMKVFFDSFPNLDVFKYDTFYGDGAAALAIAEYNAIESSERFDRGDSCRFSDLTLALRK